MECSCIRGNYNFEFYAKDAKHFVYQDMSDWIEEDGYVRPPKYIVQIKTPGFDSFIDLEMSTTCLNSITSFEISGIKDLYLSDGIYCFKTTSCGTPYIRSAAVIWNLECKWNHLVTQRKDKEDLEKISKTRFYLDQIMFNAQSNKVNQAQEFFLLASRDLDCVKCKC